MAFQWVPTMCHRLSVRKPGTRCLPVAKCACLAHVHTGCGKRMQSDAAEWLESAQLHRAIICGVRL